jgi:alkylhydroperoxidase family enzyme
LARRHGVSDEVLETLHDLENCPVTEAEKAALRFAARMTSDAGAIGAAGIEELRAHYDEAQIVELACVVGLFNYLNRFAEALGMWPTRPGEGGPDER